ncbi:hypothetical protein [Exiguobacterium sp. s127]|uniref:hypothetical protein n=1 Tax=Exiguobacterium sp. s127 TaxID=2751210 RepID=UPI001BE98827|nr:hypothetical protein [Exiguobacterium sp. s127]
MHPLSTESTRFLDDLKIYLLASGKNEQATQDIVSELEDHLRDAETDGKSVKSITGDSPAAYIQSISNELAFDWKGLWQIFGLVLVGGSSFSFFQQLSKGAVSYSAILLSSFASAVALLIVCLALILRYLSTHTVSPVRQKVLSGLFGGLFSVSILVIVFADRFIDSPTVTFSLPVSYAIGLLYLVVIIWLSISSGTWVIAIGLTAYFLPQFVLHQTGVNGLIVILSSYLISMISMNLYFFLPMLLVKRQMQK